MDSSSDEIQHHIQGFIRVYKDGRRQRYFGTDVISAGTDPSTGVRSKDVVISSETNLSARLYIPKTINPDQKLPILIYFHGGGFMTESAFSPSYHTHLNLLVAEANIVVISVNYRKAPEYPLPIAYEDSSAAIKWVISHVNGDCQQELWLTNYPDPKKVFFGGDSAGGNISHNMAIRVGLGKLGSIKLMGIILLHPFFWGKDPIGREFGTRSHMKAYTDNLWLFVNPSSSGSDDPLVNPAMETNLSKLGCNRVLVCVAERDYWRDRGWYYQEVMGKSGWRGKVETMEAKGEKHAFFLFNPSCDNAVAMRKRMCYFINQIRSKA